MVEIALSLAASMGTSVKDFWIVSNQVDMIIRDNKGNRIKTGKEIQDEERENRRGDLDSYQHGTCQTHRLRGPRKRAANQGSSGTLRTNSVNQTNYANIKVDL